MYSDLLHALPEVLSFANFFAVIVGVIAFFVGRSSAGTKGRIDELEAELARKSEEAERYRKEVDAHFDKTATLFVSMEPSGLKFELVCFVDDVEASGRTKSELHYAIFAAFKSAGIPIFGSPVVHQVALRGDVADALAHNIREERA